MSDLTAAPVLGYLAVCVGVGASTVWLGRVAWRRRGGPGAVEVALYLWMVTVVALLYAAGIIVEAPDIAAALFLVRSVLVLVIPLVWIVFALRYGGLQQLANPAWIGVLVAPTAVFVLAVLTDPWLGYAFESVTVVADGAFTYVVETRTAVVLAATAYSYLLVVAGYLVLFRLLLQSRNIARRQVAVILVGAVFPTIAGLIDFYGILPMGPSVLPLAFGLNGLFLFWGFYGTRLLVLTPVARDVVVNEMSDGVVVTDETGRIVDLNEAAESLFGVDTDTTIGESITRLHPAITIPAMADANLDPITVEQDGERIILGPRHSRLNDHRGTTRGHLLVFRNVTERERAFEELAAREEELKRTNERLETFASVVTHDLRNPLNVASGHLELAKADDSDDSHLDSIDTALHRMETIIEDVLSLARLGADAVEPAPVSLEAAAHRAWASVDTEAAELVVEADTPVEADASYLQTLFENLFRNAIDHGGRDVTVTVEQVAGGFAVEDTGPGIPPDLREEVLSVGYSTADGGTGFGLTIVQEIATIHGWTIQVTEAAGGGARFEIRDVTAAET